MLQYIWAWANSFYENGKVNNEFLCNFIGEIAKYEKYYFENKYVNYKRRMDDMFCPSNDPYEVDIWNFENMKVKLDEDPLNWDNVNRKCGTINIMIIIIRLEGQMKRYIDWKNVS